MNTVDHLFVTRKTEIELYFKYLEYLNNDNPRIITISNATGYDEVNAVEQDFVKILKANGYLLLYNLIEAIVETSLDVIFEKIKNSGLMYTQVSDKIRKLCINMHRGNFERISNSEKIKTEIEAIIDYFITQKIITLSKNVLSGRSGNLDSQKIKNISLELGIIHSANCPELQEIKNKRNSLAHGDISFTDAARNITFQELTVFKDNTLEYIAQFVLDVKDFIDNERYK